MLEVIHRIILWEGSLMRSYLAATGSLMLALVTSCAGVSAQENAKQPNWAAMPMQAPPVADQDRMACEAALQLYDERACDDNCTDECRNTGSDLSGCDNIGRRSAVACRQ